MLQMYSTRSTSRKWTTAVWQNILDIVALNAWICYKEVICGQLSRKHFIFSLAKELREQYMSYKNIPRCWTLCGNKPPNPERQKCMTSGCTNRSSIVCSSCERIFCGPCCSEPVRVVRTSICFQCTNRSWVLSMNFVLFLLVGVGLEYLRIAYEKSLSLVDETKFQTAGMDLEFTI